MTTTEDRLLRLRDVMAKTGISRAAVYEWMAAGTFPKPLQAGPKAVRWRNSDIETWMAELEPVR
jgi:prophage regulatory protein